MKTLRAGIWLCLAGSALAQALPESDPSAQIAAERARLQAERLQVTQTHDARVRECWQHFAVNDCLREVRRSRRAQLDPLRQQELALNAQERAWRTQQREQRLREKSPETRP